jgi:cytochrome c556
MKMVAAVFAVLLLAQGVSFAHEGHHHGDAGMVKLHKIMPKYAESQQRIETALDKGDLALIKKETGYLLSTVADLKKSKPHKHLNALKDYRKLAEKFAVDVKKTADFAGKGDIDGAKKSFVAAGGTCTSCHERFRD